MIKKLIALVPAAAVLASTAIAAPLRPTSFPLTYSTMADAEEIVPVKACAVAGEVVVKDERVRSEIGERSHEEKPGR